jgi:hypothetical protein
VNCEKITYFIPVEGGYECQSCKSLNTMRGMKDIHEDPSQKADTVVDLNLPEDIF